LTKENGFLALLEMTDHEGFDLERQTLMKMHANGVCHDETQLIFTAVLYVLVHEILCENRSWFD
jgi:hypothetical protein